MHEKFIKRSWRDVASEAIALVKAKVKHGQAITDADLDALHAYIVRAQLSAFRNGIGEARSVVCSVAENAQEVDFGIRETD